MVIRCLPGGRESLNDPLKSFLVFAIHIDMNMVAFYAFSQDKMQGEFGPTDSPFFGEVMATCDATSSAKAGMELRVRTPTIIIGCKIGFFISFPFPP
jgi:hypothetical protein